MSLSAKLAGSFQYEGVVAAYAHRPPYPRELFDTLAALAVDEPRHVLDLGAGDGALARPLAERMDRVDVVEISPAMVRSGQQRPGGTAANLAWYVTAAETMTLPGPYALCTAGASLHWMRPEPTLDRIGRVLSPRGVFAIVDQNYHLLPWREALVEVIVRHSRNPDYDPTFSLPDELHRRGLFEIQGRHTTAPVPFRQPIDAYVEQFHSTASLARELMPVAEAARFGAAVRAVVRDHADDEGMLSMRITATVVWGRPRRPGGTEWCT